MSRRPPRGFEVVPRTISEHIAEWYCLPHEQTWSVYGTVVMPPQDTKGWVMLAWLTGCGINDEKDAPLA